MTAAAMGHGLVTNAGGFAGPPAVQALLESGFHVHAQDAAFADEAGWSAFAAGRARLSAISASEPDAIIAEAPGLAGTPAAIVSNDHHPAPALLRETAPIRALHDNLSTLVAFPFRLVQAALPWPATAGDGNGVMVSSNRARLPLSRGAFANAAREAANALVRSLAIDCARHGVVVNAVALNVLYGEAYYPRAVFRETERGRTCVKQSVPIGRLAEPHEIGEVIAFLATAKTRFLTGAILDVSGGWPSGPQRPPG